ncbi:MAG: DUF507 family protein [Deltaproteobacteria bacterium]|nr:DUF507 family protein [Deltaproteobacteria bacterium]
MTLKAREIDFIADKIVNRLIREGFIHLKKEKSVIKEIVAQVLQEDADKERKIEQQTRELLKQFKDQIKEEEVDQSKLFTMAKRKIAKKEDFIL